MSAETPAPESQFWQLMEEYVDRADDGIDVSRLYDALTTMHPDRIVEFAKICSEYFRSSYTWKLWGAAWLIHHGAPDDTFDYFRSWLIGCGRDVFLAAIQDPDSLADIDTSNALDDRLYCIAEEAFQEVTGEDLPEFEYSQPKLEKDLDFSNADQMRRIYPRLFEKYGSMYAATSLDELIERCRQYAGDTRKWTSDDLAGFLQRFRPSGEKLDEIYAGIPFGEAIVERLVRLMKIDGTDVGDSLSPNNLVAVDGQEAIRLVDNFLSSVRALAIECRDDEMAEALDAKEFVLRSGMASAFESNGVHDEAMEELWHLTFNLLYASGEVATVFRKAVASLVGDDLYLTSYVQWPIYANKYETPDPFQAYAELWARGVRWRIDENKIVEVFTP